MKVTLIILYALCAVFYLWNLIYYFMGVQPNEGTIGAALLIAFLFFVGRVFEESGGKT